MSSNLLPRNYEPRLFGKEPRWNDLRRIGNSSIARASVAVPILGYLILFHSDLINYLKLHSSFCQDCQVPWRLHLLYFACCSFALGQVVYAWRCPQVIKSYQTGRDFFEAEHVYFCHPQNLQYLFGMFEDQRPDDPFGLLALAEGDRGIGNQQATMLSGLMGQLYFMQNRRDYWARLLVYSAYATGFALLALPAVITFVEILSRFLS